MNRYIRQYDNDYPIKYRVDYITMMCMLEELWNDN